MSGSPVRVGAPEICVYNVCCDRQYVKCGDCFSEKYHCLVTKGSLPLSLPVCVVLSFVFVVLLCCCGLLLVCLYIAVALYVPTVYAMLCCCCLYCLIT